MIYSKNFPRCARQFIDNYFEKLWKIVDIFKISCAARANMLRVVKDFWSKIMKTIHTRYNFFIRISREEWWKHHLSTQRIYRGAENSSCSGAKTFYIKFVMLDLSGQNKDRRITSQPTFQVHLLGLLGKTGFRFPPFTQRKPERTALRKSRGLWTRDCKIY